MLVERCDGHMVEGRWAGRDYQILSRGELGDMLGNDFKGSKEVSSSHYGMHNS